jgi:16S rRNA (cytidine1402-2'-O)-methyltransferase
MARKTGSAVSSAKPSRADHPSKPGADQGVAGQFRRAFPPPRGLTIVATPIGNAGDIGLRALDTLERVAAVACEDTRVTVKLLSLHGISAKLIAYHDHNADAVRPLLIQKLKAGEALALVSDAGTPLISDPGYKLVRACLDENIPVASIPGPSAVLCALTLAGLPTGRFFFAGFLPERRAARLKAVAELTAVPGSLVFYESPRRLADALADLASVLGGRPAAVARELTKRFEEVRRDGLAALAAHYAAAGAPRGEVVIVIGPAIAKARTETEDDGNLDALLTQALARASLRDAVDEVAAATGLKRRRVYQRALGLGRKR